MKLHYELKFDVTRKHKQYRWLENSTCVNQNNPAVFLEVREGAAADASDDMTTPSRMMMDHSLSLPEGWGVGGVGSVEDLQIDISDGEIVYAIDIFAIQNRKHQAF